MDNAAVYEIIKRRSSCRSFDGRPLSDTDRRELERRIAGCPGNPFGAAIRLPFLESDRTAGRKLGTYGVIRGASLYMAGVVKSGAYDVEGLGYGMERAVLEAADMGLGTCWLAGTYSRADFRDAAKLASDERVICVSPVGYPAAKRTALDTMMRGVAGSAKRKPWAELFFDGKPGNPLDASEAGEFADALEAVRLAPSGSNGQPWRVVRLENDFHFYRAVKPGSDYGRVDMGIAACHFELVARERGLAGEWTVIDAADRPPDDGSIYFMTWKAT